MSSKQEKIKELIAMQKKFIELEHQNGIDPQQYYAPDADHELNGYKEAVNNLAAEVRDAAHEEIGSKR